MIFFLDYPEEECEDPKKAVERRKHNFTPDYLEAEDAPKKVVDLGEELKDVLEELENLKDVPEEQQKEHLKFAPDAEEHHLKDVVADAQEN
uniref:Uncharacterized protein n=1 Tax=viral metagenome TaxID=1070528 RepID=A0A6C0J8Q9_9ZZZZ